MIQPETFLSIIDNSGAQIGKCIQVFNKKKNKIGTIGDIALVSVKKIKSRIKSKKVKKKEVHKVLIVRTVKKKNRYDGSSIKFHTNSAIILKMDNQIKNKYQPLGTRIFGPISNELRYNSEENYKILSLASKTL